ncbi:MerR family transcriptional regulator [Mucilaginibacter aquaedulcis]|jgi:DNA-binding transcriptional MerR regulator|uniref:helix-turn-helix domain-containing protein n=1 Tax=Mucilaginibacter aquaedulcis TaxID=1187081 RepID=UPI0025B2A996|nr:MerR family transcriptional regulator [Mucilaginibacter aquaedulcis]MDN3546951.1 MerR family transcriptional regulator [Mucilaginibacter aquaedulcis]
MFGEVFQKNNIENIFNAFGICDSIFKPALTVNDLGISYRTINNWEANGLMLSGRKSNRDWHKFSFVDFIWLNIVFELRQLGFPLKKIQSLKTFLNENIDDDSLLAVKRLEARIFLTNTSLNRLVLLLAEIMYNKNHIALLCNKEGGFYIYSEQQVKEENSNIDLSKFLFSNFVSVSLTDVIIKYLVVCGLEIIECSKIIDETFFNILTKLRSKEISSLTFQINEDESLEVRKQLFKNYDEFVSAAIRMILTLKFEEVIYKD